MSSEFILKCNDVDELGNEVHFTIMLEGYSESGATFIPTVSEDGVLSWENDMGLENPEPVNIKGGKGDPGEKGNPGKKGEPGYTPQRGVDYWTEADKTEIIQAVFAQVVDGNEVAY